MAAGKPIIPEVVVPDEALPADLVALRRFARLMDEALPVPGTKRRIGLDAGLGLIPGVGDVVAALLSVWIVIGALRWRVPLWRVVRMVFNILVDLVLGAIPLFGDIFDLFFEENVMNLNMLLRYRDRTRPPRRFAEVAGASLVVIGVILAFGLMVLIALVAAVIWLINHR